MDWADTFAVFYLAMLFNDTSLTQSFCVEPLQYPIRELKPSTRTHAVLNRRARISINDVQNVQNALQALEKQAQFSAEQPPAHQHSEEPEEEIDLGEQEEQEEQEEDDDDDVCPAFVFHCLEPTSLSGH